MLGSSAPPPKWQFDLIQSEAKRCEEAATWLGQITAFANHFPNPVWAEGMPRAGKFLRDAQGERPGCCKPKLAPPPLAPLGPGVLLAVESSARLLHCQSPVCACALCRLCRSKGHRCVGLEAPRGEVLAHEAQVAAWISSRELTPGSGPTDLLARIVARGARYTVFGFSARPA